MYMHLTGCRENCAGKCRSMYIHTMKQVRVKVRSEVVPLPCACANLRRAARIVTQRYDRELQRAGIKATQFTLLQALERVGGIPQGRLGDLLGLDSTTLTRTLALLRRNGWIQRKPGEDRRQVRLTLTREGKRKYQSALRYWRLAQKQLRKSLGEAGWRQMIGATIRAAAIADEN